MCKGCHVRARFACRLLEISELLLCQQRVLLCEEVSCAPDVVVRGEFELMRKRVAIMVYRIADSSRCRGTATIDVAAIQAWHASTSAFAGYALPKSLLVLYHKFNRASDMSRLPKRIAEANTMAKTRATNEYVPENVSPDARRPPERCLHPLHIQDGDRPPTILRSPCAGQKSRRTNKRGMVRRSTHTNKTHTENKLTNQALGDNLRANLCASNMLKSSSVCLGASSLWLWGHYLGSEFPDVLGEFVEAHLEH
jgi:hypothetical protein